MPNSYFAFKQFSIRQDRCAMKVTTDGCLFGAWVAHEISECMNSKTKALDVGAGTGLLSLMLAQKTEASVEAIELEPSAAAQANENVLASPWAGRIDVMEKDVREWQSPQLYDWILSNPPFYENSLKANEAATNAARHDDGLTLSALLSFIETNLSPFGTFFLLLPASRERDLVKVLAERELQLHKLIRVRPAVGKATFRLMVQGGKTETAAVSESEILIKDSAGNYSETFALLLKDYYLNL